MDCRVKTHITPLDVINAGACTSGVFRWLTDNGVKKTVMSVKAALKLCTNDEAPYIEKAANMCGYGVSDGDGYGYGDGDGYG